jgi:formate hydrogenlyase subunit 4
VDLMTAASVASAAVEVVGGLAFSPLTVGFIQHWKARLQGRRGPSPLQPYRELRRLWGKGVVDVAGTTAVYRLAPAVIAASTVAALAVVPASASAPNLGLGHDFILLAGLLVVARFAAALSTWDVANGFSLMGASRDLTISVFAEVALLVAFTVPAALAGTSDLAVMIAHTAGGAVWSGPALPLGAAGFAIVVVAETGRQPFDNPDTHLELTMIHEGPLLEYAGRDLAYLQWAAAARHWLMLVLAAELFVPHLHSAWAQLGLLPVEVAVLCAGLALTETLVAKMRLLVAPRLLAVAVVASALGVVTRSAGMR